MLFYLTNLSIKSLNVTVQMKAVEYSVVLCSGAVDVTPYKLVLLLEQYVNEILKSY